MGFLSLLAMATRLAMVDLMFAIPVAASCTDSWITLIPLFFMLTASPRRVFACGTHHATRLHSGGLKGKRRREEADTRYFRLERVELGVERSLSREQTRSGEDPDKEPELSLCAAIGALR